MSRTRTDCEGFHRRDVLRVGVAGLLGMSLPDALRAEALNAPDARVKKPATGVIQIWLAGGPATIDMWDLKPDAPEGIRGEFRPIATSAPGVSICEHMPGLAKVMDRCTLVRSLGHSISAHGPGTTYMATGNRPGPALEYPAAGALAARLLPPRQGVPPYVTFAALRDGVSGTGPGYLGPAFGPFEVEGDPLGGRSSPAGCRSPTGFALRDLESREALRDRFDRGLRALDSAEVMAGLDRFHRQAAEILLSDRVRAALDLSREPDALRDDYGRTTLGQGVLAARRLIEAGARFVTLGFGGWDTHGDNFRAPQEPPPAPAGQGDLDPGPRPGVSRAAGRDDRRLRRGVRPDSAGQQHGRARPLVAVDGRAPGRRRVPRRRRLRVDRRPRDGPVRDACSPDDLAATLFQRLGFGPRHEVRSAGGRPIPIFREGRCLEPLVG